MSFLFEGMAADFDRRYRGLLIVVDAAILQSIVTYL